MSEDQSTNTEHEPIDRGRWRKPVLIVVGIVLAVWILFTWVFPWITEMGLSPALD